MQRVLIVGGDGTIGRELASALAESGRVVWSTTRRNISSCHSNRIALDLATDDLSRVHLPDVDVAVICAAMSRFADCREQPDLAYHVNVIQPEVLSRRLSAAGARIVLLSTSAVFDCRTPRVPADRSPSPASAYGRQKAEGERRVLAVGSTASVLRLTKVVTPHWALLREWIAKLRSGERIEAYTDLTISPITKGDAVTALLAILEDTSGGIYQVSGAEDVSYADIARHLCRRIGADASNVRPVRGVDRGVPPGEIAQFTSLDVERLNRLCGYRAPCATDVLDAVFKLEPQTSARSHEPQWNIA